MPFLTSQVGVADMTGAAELFRKRPAGRIVNNGDVRNVGGFNIDVSGTNTRWEKTTRTAIEPGKGVRSIKPETAASVMAPSTLSASLEAQEITWGRDMLDEARNRSVEGTMFEGMGIAATVEITQTNSLPIESVAGMGYYDREINSGAEDIAYLGDQLTRAGELAKIERELSQEFGEPVKLAWDAAGQEYLMLRRGQDGYDRVNSAQKVFDTTVKRGIGEMGYRREDFRDVLTRYGVTV